MKIIFLCHGNICRSPMAEFVMKKLVREAGREAEFEIDSMAVSSEEIGNPIYPPAKAKMREKAVPFGDHRAHKITPRSSQGRIWSLLWMSRTGGFCGASWGRMPTGARSV